MILLALIMADMVMHPDSKYRDEVGVELGTEKVLCNIPLSIVSNSSISASVTLYHIYELVRMELKNMLSLNRKAFSK